MLQDSVLENWPVLQHQREKLEIAGPQLIAFNPHVIKHQCRTFLGYATVLCPKGSWKENEKSSRRYLHQPHGICKKMLDGGLLLSVTVVYEHRVGEVVIGMPCVEVKPSCGKEHGKQSFQDLVMIDNEVRREIVRQICLRVL